MRAIRSPGFRSFARAAAICVIGTLLIVAAAPSFTRVVFENKILDDFHVVYSGARAMLDRTEIHAATHGMYIYSPLLAFLFQPVALLPENIASICWIIASSLIFLATTLLSSQKIANTWHLVSFANGRDRSAPLIMAAGALLLSFTKIRSDLILGQTDCLILLGLSLILCWLDSRPAVAAVAVGVTANFKYLALIFVPYFITKRKYREALVALVSFAFFFILPVVEIGGRLISGYVVNAGAVFTKVFGGRELAHKVLAGHVPVVNSITWNGSVSLTSSLFRLTDLVQAPWFIAAFGVATVFVGVSLALVVIGRRRNVELFRPFAGSSGIARSQTLTLEWATLIVLALIFGPQTTARHMIMLIPVYLVAIALVLREHNATPRTLLATLMIVTATSLSLPFRETGPHPALVVLKLSSVASWCALVLVFSICVIGASQIADRGS